MLGIKREWPNSNSKSISNEESDPVPYKPLQCFLNFQCGKILHILTSASKLCPPLFVHIELYNWNPGCCKYWSESVCFNNSNKGDGISFKALLKGKIGSKSLCKKTGVSRENLGFKCMALNIYQQVGAWIIRAFSSICHDKREGLLLFTWIPSNFFVGFPLIAITI